MSEKNWKDDADFVRHAEVRDKDGNLIPFDLKLGKRLAKENVIFLGVATGETPKQSGDDHG